MQHFIIYLSFIYLFFIYLFIYLFVFLDKIRLDISCESSAWQTIHMK